MVSAWRRITYRKSNFNGCAGNGDCVYRNFTFGSNYQYSERAGNVRAHFFEEAFDFKAIFGAFSGSAMMQGIRRGLIPMRQVSVPLRMHRLRQMSVIR